MKLLVFSDNHGEREPLIRILKDNPGCDRYISLGDSEMKEAELTQLNVFGVRGNYPTDPHFPLDLTFELNGVKTYITHGHYHAVKFGLNTLLNKCLYNHIELCMYGHTHIANITEYEDVILFNPGALSYRRVGTKQSYALVEITDDFIHVKILNLNGETIKELRKKRIYGFKS